MTFLTFPAELQPEVFALIKVPTTAGSITMTVKVEETVPEDKLEQLKKLGVKYLTPV